MTCFCACNAHRTLPVMPRKNPGKCCKRRPNCQPYNRSFFRGKCHCTIYPKSSAHPMHPKREIRGILAAKESIDTLGVRKNAGAGAPNCFLRNAYCDFACWSSGASFARLACWSAPFNSAIRNDQISFCLIMVSSRASSFSRTCISTRYSQELFDHA